MDGYTVLERAGTLGDCFAYVAKRLNMPGGDRALEDYVLGSMKNGKVLSEPKDHCIVLYLQEPPSSGLIFPHLGIYEEGRVTSKWGVSGAVVEHEGVNRIIPSTFGYEVMYIDLPDNVSLIKHKKTRKRH